ncbi:MAG: D-alanyl-D-alanine carboxypeptidase family protein [Alphaproteobacteria bacterium]
MTLSRIPSPTRVIAGLGVLVALLFALPGTSAAFETSAKYAYLVDMQTGAVLFEKSAAEPMAPASMTKMMTIYMLFERLKDGRLTTDTMLPVSETAWRMAGSKTFVHIGDKVKVDDLIRGIIVQSGNDACVVAAEAMGGSEAAFAEEMTKRAREIGMTGSRFKNSNGWPDPEHVTTARDLAVLAKRTILDFPQYYPYYGETEYTYNNIRQANRNPLLYKNIGVDGLKTGHTDISGYGLTASAKRGDRRLIMVINGLESEKARAEESERLIEWGFNEFENVTVFKGGETIESAEVWLGRDATVPLVLEQDILVTVPKKSRSQLKAVVQYQGPVPAPITKGTKIAKLVISAPGVDSVDVPLVAGVDVAELGFFGRVGAGFKALVMGH